MSMSNKAPEKIYIFDNPILDFTKLSVRQSSEDIEYTRTDAFIKKACEWLSKVSIEHMHYQYNDFDTSEDWYKFIEEFKKYMKGE